MQLRPLSSTFLIALACSVPAAPAAQAAPAPRVTVMTRNLFLGADLIPLATDRPGRAVPAGRRQALRRGQCDRPGRPHEADRARDRRRAARPGRPPGGLAVAHRAGARVDRGYDYMRRDQGAQAAARALPGRRAQARLQRRGADRPRVRHPADARRRDPRAHRRQGQPRARRHVHRAADDPDAGDRHRDVSRAAGTRSTRRSTARASTSSTPTWRPTRSRPGSSRRRSSSPGR